jgi:hypothetical protein
MQRALGCRAQALGHAVRGLHAGQCFTATLQVAAADLGQGLLAGGALYQARAQLLFQCTHMFAHHHGGQVQRLPGGGKAVCRGRRHKDLHAAEFVAHIQKYLLRVSQ